MFSPAFPICLATCCIAFPCLDSHKDCNDQSKTGKTYVSLWPTGTRYGYLWNFRRKLATTPVRSRMASPPSGLSQWHRTALRPNQTAMRNIWHESPEFPWECRPRAPACASRSSFAVSLMEPSSMYGWATSVFSISCHAVKESLILRKVAHILGLFTPDAPDEHDCWPRGRSASLISVPCQGFECQFGSFVKAARLGVDKAPYLHSLCECANPFPEP